MIEIKKATLSDLEAVLPLFDAYRVWYRKESNLDQARTFLSDRLSQNDSVIYLAWNNEKAVGFTQLYPSFSSTRMKRMWILNDLYIDEEYRGQGISKQLINAAKNLTNETKACGILLETETSNDIGNRLYPATGFELEKNNFYFWRHKTLNTTNEY